MTHAASSEELELFRTPGQWSRIRAAIYTPTTIYTARINQSFSTRDKVLEITYDGGSGTLANVLPDMTVFFGNNAGGWGKGIARLRSIDSTKIYIGETADINFADNDHITIVDDFGLWAKPVLISSGVIYMDGGVAYSNQHTNYLPLIRGGPTARVAYMPDSDVEVSFSFPATVPNSSVSSRSTSAPSAASITGGTTSTPSVLFDSLGWHRVYHTVTAANGKSSFIVRYVFVWNETNEPESVELLTRRGDVDSGGWEVSLRLYDQANLTQVRDHALIVLFAEDYYGASEDSLGPVSPVENVVFCGWIGKESIDWDPDGGSVSFTAYGPQYFLQKIPAWPDGVQFTTNAPADWTKIKNLTVDLGIVHHFMQWRTTAPKIIDIYESGDTKYTKEVASLASDLWSQIREMGWDQIFARALCNRLGQLYIQVHPQFIPEGSRTHPTVISFLEEDLEKPVSLDRVTMSEASIVDLSGVKINSSGVGTAYFSLSPGHSHSHYGNPVVMSRLLLESQAHANQMAGLYRGWMNNPFPNIPLKPSANNRLIDICPLQKCELEISSAFTPRGFADTLGLVPKAIEDVFDASTGYERQEITFEAETFEDLSVKAEPPGSGNISIPPLPPLPPLPPIVPIIPGTIPPVSEGGPLRVIMHDTTAGLLYSEDFNESSPHWQTINDGLTQAQYQAIDTIVPGPAGELYVAHRGSSGERFIAYSPGPGETFTVLETAATIAAKFTGSINQGVNALGVDPISGQAAYVISSGNAINQMSTKIYIGSGTSFADGGASLNAIFIVSSIGNISYGNGKWRLTGNSTDTTNAKFLRLSADGSTVEQNTTVGTQVGADTSASHVALDTTDSVLMLHDNAFLLITQNGAVAGDFTNLIGSLLNYEDFWDNATAADPTGTLIMTSWDTGARGRSSDGGATITGIPNLPFGGRYAYDYAGGEGAESRWVAARAIVRYSPDRGDTWESREGDLSGLSPVPLIDVIKVLEF